VLGARRRLLLLAGLFAVGVILCSHAVFLSTLRPGVTSPHGWYGGVDQHKYLVEAEDLARGDLPRRAEYLYGLGYPAAAVPALKLGFVGDPFTPFDVLAFGAMLTMTAVLGERLHSLRLGVLAALALAVATPALSAMAMPWNTTVSVLAGLAGLLVATAPRPPSWRQGLVLGLAVGVCFAARYVDALFPLAVGGAGLLRWGRRARPAAVAAGAATLVLVGAVLWTHAAVLGSPLTTPYASRGRAHSEQSLSGYRLADVPRHGLEVFVTGNDDGKRTGTDPLLARFPWAVLAPAGAVLLLRRRHPLRGPLLVAAAMSIAFTVLYLAFPAGGGHDLVYGNQRYFLMQFPLWAVLAGISVAALLDRAPSGRE
jgi:hypothetical protein